MIITRKKSSGLTEKQMAEQQQQLQMERVLLNKSSGLTGSSNDSTSLLLDDYDEDISKSALAMFRAKEEEIERKKIEVRGKVHAQIGRAEEATKRLAEIRQELEALTDPLRKEVSIVRKRIDIVNRELKPLGLHFQKKEREYREAHEAFNEKNKEKTQLLSQLMEVEMQMVGESERLRMKKLDELTKHIQTLR
ncbi:hypothetical protein LINPERPRIM_LOCUS22412 [Linum perenne]